MIATFMSNVFDEKCEVKRALPLENLKECEVNVATVPVIVSPLPEGNV